MNEKCLTECKELSNKLDMYLKAKLFSLTKEELSNPSKDSAVFRLYSVITSLNDLINFYEKNKTRL